MHVSREAVLGVLLGCFSAVALVVFAITATHDAFSPGWAATAITLFGLFLIAQQWF